MAIFSYELTGNNDQSGPQAIRRILIPCAWLAVIFAALAWVFLSFNHALAFIGGTIVGCLNLIFLTLLVQQILVASGSRNYLTIALILALKILIVYGGLAGLLIWETTPIIGVVSGFSLILLVITLKAAGRALIASGILESGKSNGTESYRSDA